MGEKILVFCDGACRGNQYSNNIGAWAYHMRYKELIKESSGYALNTSNNKMELISLIMALKNIKRKTDETIVTMDSAYVVNGLNDWIQKWKRSGWKTSKNTDVENMDLWQELDELWGEFNNIKIQHCKGHSDNEGNNRADELCNLLLDDIVIADVDTDSYDYVVIDFETGGLSASKHALVSVGAVFLNQNLDIVGEYYTIINEPNKEITEIALQVNGITLEEIQKGKNIYDVLNDLKKILNGKKIVCHNAKFDMGFLNERGFAVGRAIDTLTISREIWKGESNKLGDVCERLGIAVVDAHNALADVKMTAQVLKKLYEIEGETVLIPMPLKKR